MKFPKTIKGAESYYESIESYDERAKLKSEYDASLSKSDTNSELNFYKWIRDNKLKRQ